MQFQDKAFIILVRHGEVKAKTGTLYGQIDVPLSKRGILQSLNLIKSLESLDKKLKIHQIFTSPLKRCLFPAEKLAKSLKVPLIIEDDLKELNFGKWSGKTWEELAQLKEFWEFYKNENFSPPEGESIKDLKQRVKKFLKKLITLEKENLKNVVIFTHSGFIRAFFVEVFSLPMLKYFNVEILPCKLVCFNFFLPDTFILKFWNISPGSLKIYSSIL